MRGGVRGAALFFKNYNRKVVMNTPQTGTVKS
jgi:hypothetical protein